MSISKNMKGSFSRGAQDKDSAWSDLAEAFTAAALNNIAGNNGNSAIKPVTIPATSVKFSRGNQHIKSCTNAVQVDWNALNTSGLAGSGLQVPNIETKEYPVTGPGLSQADIDAQIAAFQQGAQAALTSKNVTVDGVFITGDGTGHEDIIGVANGSPVVAFHNKNNAFSKGDGRDFGLSGAAHSALAALMTGNKKQNMINQYFAFLLRQFKTIVKGSAAAGQTGATVSGTVGNKGMKQKGGIPRITAVQFKTDFDNDATFRDDLEACLKARTTAVTSFRLVSTYPKNGGYQVPSISHKFLTLAAGSIANGSCTLSGNQIYIKDAGGNKVCKITCRSDDNRIAQVLMQNTYYRKGNLLGENKMRKELKQTLRKALNVILEEVELDPEVMDDLEAAAMEPSGYPGFDALPAEDDALEAEIDMELEEANFHSGNVISEGRWLKLAGLL